MSLLLGVLKRRIVADVYASNVSSVSVAAKNILKAEVSGSNVSSVSVEARNVIKSSFLISNVNKSTSNLKITQRASIKSNSISTLIALLLDKGEVINPDFPFFSPRYKYFKRSFKMDAFAEVRFEGEIVTLDMSGGPTFSTTVITTNGGKEQRQSNWEQPRGRWQLGNRLLTPEEAKEIKKFFMNRKGKFQAFRLRDWTDYEDDGGGILNDGLTKPEVTEYRTFKKYISGTESYLRQIYKPVQFGYRNDFMITIAGDTIPFQTMATPSAEFVYDFTTGVLKYNPPVLPIVSFTPILGQTDILFEEPHNLDITDYVNFAGNIVRIVQIIDPLTIRIQFNSSMIMEMVNSIEKRLPLNAQIKWFGEYDIPVRFDSDTLPMTFVHGQYGESGVDEKIDGVFVQLGDLQLVELKL